MSADRRGYKFLSIGPDRLVPSARQGYESRPGKNGLQSRWIAISLQGAPDRFEGTPWSEAATVSKDAPKGWKISGLLPLLGADSTKFPLLKPGLSPEKAGRTTAILKFCERFFWFSP